MGAILSLENEHKLQSKKVIWFSSVRPDGRPHLTPIWFVWLDKKLFICTDPNSVKIQNIKSNAHVTVALEDGMHPVICEGLARILTGPAVEVLCTAFYQKYEWDPSKDEQYNQMVEITPLKWMSW